MIFDHSLKKDADMSARLVVFYFILFLALSTTDDWTAAQPGPPPGTTATHFPLEKRAAIIGQQTLPKLVTDENAKVLGFLSKAEATSVDLGAPFKIYIVDLHDLRNFDPATSKVVGLLKEMQSLIFPLVTDRQDGKGTQARSAIVVSKRKDKSDNTKSIWIPTNWGLALLAQGLDEYRTKKAPEFSSGFAVWIPALNLHFLGDQLTEDLVLIPLADRKAYGLIRGVPISAKIVFALYAREARSIDENKPG
jgi:hypothetical protein